MKSPLVSICIPAYKTEYLEQSINSAVQQTYENIEIIILDDCSPANVEEIVLKFNSTKIKFYQLEENVGNADPSYTWEKAIQLSKGELVSILCDDDYYCVDFIENLVNLYKKYPCATVFRSGVYITDHTGTVIDFFPSSPELQNLESYLFEILRGFQHQTISEFIFKRDILEKIGGFVHLPKAWGTDVLTVLYCLRGGGLVTSHMKLCFYRDSDISISGNYDSNINEKLKANEVFHKNITQLIIDTTSDKLQLLMQLNAKSYYDNKWYLLLSSPMRTLFSLLVNTEHNKAINKRTVIYCLCKKMASHLDKAIIRFYKKLKVLSQNK